jgi:hypothetical protein
MMRSTPRAHCGMGNVMRDRALFEREDGARPPAVMTQSPTSLSYNWQQAQRR